MYVVLGDEEDGDVDELNFMFYIPFHSGAYSIHDGKRHAILIFGE